MRKSRSDGCKRLTYNGGVIKKRAPKTLPSWLQPPTRHAYNKRMDITLPDLEQAINYWRALRPSSGEERALSPEVNALATIYALMIFEQKKTVSVESLDPVCQQLVASWRKRF